MRSLLKESLGPRDLLRVLLAAPMMLPAASNRPGLAWGIWLSGICSSPTTVGSDAWLAEANGD